MEYTEVIEAIYKEYATGIQRMCYLYLGDFQLAEDAMQETFVKVYRNYPNFQNKSSIKTWVTRIAINTCKDILLGLAKVPYSVNDEEFAACLFETETVRATGGGYTVVEDQMTISRAINQLEGELREVVILFYYQELSTKDIAQITGQARTTVEFRLKQARKFLKKELKGAYFNE